MAIYQLTVNTEKYNVKQCSSKNWKPGTQNDYMQAINGIQRDLKNIQEVEWQLELFQGNFRMGMNDTEKLDSYNRFLEENIITYHDKICDLDRKQFLSGYGCMPGTYKPAKDLEDLKQCGYVKILFKSFYDIRHYDISMDGCYLEIREVLDQEDTKLIRKYLDEIYNESEILPENFGNEILQEVANCLQEDHYEITKKNVLNEMLWCYMCNMQ